MTNLLGEPPETRLPDDPAESEASDADPRTVAASHPSSSHAWAVLAENALAAGDQDIEAYAFARTGYHRGLDALRRNGWKGFGPVPWSHEPNQGFLRCVTELAKASEAIGETAETQRLTELLRDCDPSLAA